MGKEGAERKKERKKERRKRGRCAGVAGGRGGQEEGLAGKWKIEFAASLPLPLRPLGSEGKPIQFTPERLLKRAARQRQGDATNQRASFAKETDKLEEDRANTDSG